MTKLPLQFTKNGFLFNQVFRSGRVAIYHQTKYGQAQSHFEVGLIRENAEYEIHGRTIEPHESWPKSEDWGVKAWTYFSLDEAKKRAEQLINNQKGTK